MKTIYLFVITFIVACTALTNEVHAQYRFRTVRDTSKYSEKKLDIKIFRAFNNIHSNFINSLVNITNKSLIVVTVAAPIGMYAAARINNNHYDESSAVLLALSEGVNEGVTHLLKTTVKRNRPYRTLNGVYLTDTSEVNGGFSFPSGHSSGSFVIATSLTLRYPDKPALIAGLYTYAALVALGRIYWGVHYPSDVFTGMLIGAGSAALIYSLRVPIIKAKNKLFNQSERTDAYSTGFSTPAFLISIAAADLINNFLSRSSNTVLSNSSFQFTASSKVNSLHYNFNF